MGEAGGLWSYQRDLFSVGVYERGGREGGGEVGGSKRGMVAERCPLLGASDKDRLAPQVSEGAKHGAGGGDAPTGRLTNIS